MSDSNSYALGGIAGHAGLFTHADAIHTLALRLMFARADDPWVNQTTAKLFTTIYNVSQSSRALGWDTNSYAMSQDRSCGNLSSATYTHTGYTGTQVCNDPTRGLITVLLTNRVYPNASAESMAKIHTARQRFNNAVLAVVQSREAAQKADHGTWNLPG